jgi:hypothetical protein
MTMKRHIGAAMLMSLLALAAVAGTASAQCGNGLLIKFDADAWAYETNYTAATFNSASGSQLNVVGVVSVFCSPLLPTLDASNPAKEYTFLFTGLTSPGTTTTNLAGGNVRYQTVYGSGQFSIYEDTSPDAPRDPNEPALPSPLVPAKYIDGTLVLSGTLANFTTTVTKFTNGSYSTSFRSDYLFTGGTQYALVANTGTGLLSGAWCAAGNATGLCSLPTGYSSHPNGKFDQPTTTTQSSTWGAIKQLYR